MGEPELNPWSEKLICVSDEETDFFLARHRLRIGTLVGRWFATKTDDGYRHERGPALRLRLVGQTCPYCACLPLL